MYDDYSYGIIPVKKQDGLWETFLVRLLQGHWGWPKGHPEGSEEPKQTAVRELFEETGLSIKKFYDIDPFIEEYSFSGKSGPIRKRVCYWIAEVEGEAILQEKELLDGKWVPLNVVPQFLTFKEPLKLLDRLILFLNSQESL